MRGALATTLKALDPFIHAAGRQGAAENGRAVERQGLNW